MEEFVDILLKVGVVFMIIFSFLIFVIVEAEKNNFVECFSSMVILRNENFPS
ncbi:hypothetical protein [Thermaerobacillus caldiproteolyticus]|uniref:hypothetical protein n=1 Tax=Thermaerobacillus caldiproteolyticus TaxID=247480 RepID=UPI0015EBC2B0|nr:hypothetical protein [Anoxybacillus caldiproteolyticus]